MVKTTSVLFPLVSILIGYIIAYCMILNNEELHDDMAQVLRDIVQVQQNLVQELSSFKKHDLEHLHQRNNVQTHDRSVFDRYSVALLNELDDIDDNLYGIYLMLERMVKRKLPIDCSDAPVTGQYKLFLQRPDIQLDSLRVICDMDSLPGGWIVFQRRFDGSVSFDVNWADYEEGFGSLDGEFWIGLKTLNVLTNISNRWQLRVDLEDFEHNRAYAIYDNFRVGDASSNYRLSLGSYVQGNAGDAMRGHYDLHGMEFTTKDQDHDRRNSGNCGVHLRSGWWHNRCTHANVNGLYLGQNGDSFRGMAWYDWKNNWSALKKTELKIRPVH